MELHHTDDAEEYAAAVGAFLDSDPCRLNLLRTVVESVRNGATVYSGPPGFWWADDCGRVVAAASWTPPFHLLLSAGMTELAPRLADSAARRCRLRSLVLPGTRGPRAAAAATAAAWAELTGEETHQTMVEVLHRLSAVIEPPKPQGSWRVAEPRDVDLLAGWLVAFATEAGMVMAPNPARTVTGMVVDGRCWLWEFDREAVAMVARTAPAASVVRVGPVYTPPRHRRRGYARRLTFEVTSQALDAGATDVLLFTDAANPTSNSIYRQVGFQPIEEHVTFSFGSARS